MQGIIQGCDCNANDFFIKPANQDPPANDAYWALLPTDNSLARTFSIVESKTPSREGFGRFWRASDRFLIWPVFDFEAAKLFVMSSAQVGDSGHFLRV